jgi:hypothetical protein
MTRNSADMNQATGKPRRALLAGAGAALGVITAKTLVSGSPAQADQASAVLEGTDNTGATRRTAVFTTDNTEWVALADPNTSGKGSLGVYGHGEDFGVFADSSGNGTGVAGLGAGIGAGLSGTGGPDGGPGVTGTGGGKNGPGIAGLGAGLGAGLSGTGGPDGGPGVAGLGAGLGAGLSGTGGPDGGPGVTGTGSGIEFGIQGFGGRADGGGGGVLGESSSGTGVHGKSAAAGAAGVLAENTSGGPALRVAGPAVFGRSGVMTVGAGSSSVTKRKVALTTASLVLATLQDDVPGVWVRSAVPNVDGHSFTVHLSATVKASTKVAWFVVN